MAGHSPLTAVVAEPVLLADALARFLRLRGVDDRGVPAGVSARVVVTVAPDLPGHPGGGGGGSGDASRVWSIADLTAVLERLR